MNVDRRAFGIGTAITAVILWIVALLVDAPTVVVVIPIIGMMIAGVVLVTAEKQE